MKKIGFLSFGHWANHSPAYKTRSAADTLLQSIDLAVAAEQMGIDGAYFRVHHFVLPVDITFLCLRLLLPKQVNRNGHRGGIDMRYENPLYMVEEAGATDLISKGRLQLRISKRISGTGNEKGWRYFGYEPTKEKQTRR